ncbi:MAG: VOC family protein [Rhodospirillaceae bacterium]
MVDSPPSPRLDHLNIVVADMAASANFYRTLFDMTVALDSELRGPWFESVTGLPGAVAHCVILRGADPGFRIELLKYREPAGTPEPATSRLPTEGLRHFAVRIADIDSTLARARSLGYAEGIEPVQVPFEILPAGKRMVYLRDPDGVVVELAEYGTNRLTAKES